MSRTIVAYHPGTDFIPVSLTGRRCDLQCEHCKGHFLQHMLDASAPGSLIRIAERLKANGGTGILISGGCDREGRLPLMDRLQEIKEVRSIGLMLNIHTGHLSRNEALLLAEVGAERFSMDLHQSPHVIEHVLHMSTGPEAYEATLDALCHALPGKIVPHVCAGLDGDRIISEKRCVDLVKGRPIAGLVILGHVPISDAPHRPQPSITEASLLELIEYAVNHLDRPVMLGCMRGRRSNWLELEAARAGAAGIANPKVDTLEALGQEGFTIRHQRSCCALHL